jgi:hypothetical protein
MQGTARDALLKAAIASCGERGPTVILGSSPQDLFFGAYTMGIFYGLWAASMEPDLGRRLALSLGKEFHTQPADAMLELLRNMDVQIHGTPRA